MAQLQLWLWDEAVIQCVHTYSVWWTFVRHVCDVERLEGTKVSLLVVVLLLGVVVLRRCLYGGASKALQARQLQRNPQLIIATPGRLLDFVNSGEVNLSRVSCSALSRAWVRRQAATTPHTRHFSL